MGQLTCDPASADAADINRTTLPGCSDAPAEPAQSAIQFTSTWACTVADEITHFRIRVYEPRIALGNIDVHVDAVRQSLEIDADFGDDRPFRFDGVFPTAIDGDAVGEISFESGVAVFVLPKRKRRRRLRLIQKNGKF
ncbi:hypothetical protein BDZ88DRAFT_456034 [Geranomyces variabilis]|nr:hypothetical protein BDZ88DRAFT_456034 [Geranomyces variabilis]KAJ3134402.1 hypothetical protein HDU90_005015 [Geranomyces variabilis]